MIHGWQGIDAREFADWRRFLFCPHSAGAARAGDGETAPARDLKQGVDEAYTAKMKK